MLKPVLLGGALLLAIPAFAQTTGSAGTAAQDPVGTTTNDHDPTFSGDPATTATATGTIGTQVNGGTTSSSPGMGVGATAQTDMHGCSQGAAASSAGSANSGGARGTAASTCGTMQHGSATGSGTMTGSASTGTESYTGTGGPDTGARTYPPCTRTRTDNCRQRGGR
ncbi:MAG: hypothetical protein ACJ8ER_00420 [Allosphingosinicella sp.]